MFEIIFVFIMIKSMVTVKRTTNSGKDTTTFAASVAPDGTQTADKSSAQSMKVGPPIGGELCLNSHSDTL
jgi:hypothetical protein